MREGSGLIITFRLLVLVLVSLSVNFDILKYIFILHGSGTQKLRFGLFFNIFRVNYVACRWLGYCCVAAPWMAEVEEHFFSYFRY